MANCAWKDLFSSAKITLLTSHHSNHGPLLLPLQPSPLVNLQRGKRPFRFEPMWAREQVCKEKVSQDWGVFTLHGNGLHGSRVDNLMASLGTILRKWGKETFGKLEEKIKGAKMKLQDVIALSGDGKSFADAQKLKRYLDQHDAY